MGYSTPVVLPLHAQNSSTVDVLRVAAVNLHPYISVSQAGSQVSVAGPMKVVLEALNALLNSSLTIGFAGDLTHGARLENGTFTGAMGLIEKRQVEIFLGPAIMTAERSDLTEAMILDTSTYRLLTWEPSKWVDPFQFAAAFTVDVWTSILFSVLFLSLTCWLFDKFLTPWNPERKDALSHFLWQIPSRVLSFDQWSRNDAWLRICLSGFFLVFPLVFMNSLNSKLISAMTIKRDEDSIRNYKDVLRFPQVRIYSEAGSRFSLMFTDPRSATFYKLRSRLIPKRGIFSYGPTFLAMMSEVEAKKRVITGTPEMCRAFIIRAMEKRGRCLKLMTTTESSGLILGSYLVSMALPLPMRGAIRSVTSTVMESSVFAKLLSFTALAAEKCQRRKGVSTEPLVLQNVEGSFILWAIGLSISTAICIIEMFIHQLKLYRKQVT